MAVTIPDIAAVGSMALEERRFREGPRICPLGNLTSGYSHQLVRRASASVSYKFLYLSPFRSRRSVPLLSLFAIWEPFSLKCWSS